MNFFLKSVFSQFGGFVLSGLAASVDTAIQHPSGGLAATLGTHPWLLTTYVFGIGVVHNYLTAKYPTAAGSTESPSPVAKTN